MTPAEALAIAATIGKRLKDAAELEAFRMVWRAYNNPLEAQMEAVRKLRPGPPLPCNASNQTPSLGNGVHG